MNSLAPADSWLKQQLMDPLPAEELVARKGRQYLRAVLAQWGMRHLADDGEVIVSELIANAVDASRNRDGDPICGPGGRPLQVALRLRTDGTRLRIEVFDQATGVPEPRNAATWAESGRGLALVDYMTQGRWGYAKHSAPGWKFVFAELSFPLPESVAVTET